MILADVGFLAVENVAVAYVRGRVPEFEPAFGRLLDEEGYWELGSIHTFAELARWLIDEATEEAAGRTFQAVEFVLTQRSMREGHDEAIEFFEALAAEAVRGSSSRFQELRAFWGKPTLGWMTSFRAELVSEAD